MSNGPETSGPAKPALYAYYVLGVLFFINFFNYVDRFVLFVVLDDVTEQLVTDTAILGKLEGLLASVFTLGYMIAAPFAAGFGDRWLRVRIVSICCFLWSLATLGTAFAGSYSQLLVCRAFIGVGEAGFLAIGPTIVADYFPRRIRGTMLSVFYLGMPLGGPAGYVLGEKLTRFFAEAEGPFHAWRGAFFAVAIPGFALAVLAWFLREPERGQMDDADASSGAPHHHHLAPPRLADYGRLFKNRSFLMAVLALTGVAASNGGFLPWFAEYLEDVKEVPKKVASEALGGVIILAGLVGNMLGGVLGDVLYARTKKAHAIITGVAFLLGSVFLILSLSLHGKWLPLGLGLAGGVCFFTCTPALNTLIANVSRPEVRAAAFAAALFFMHAFGDLISPLVFGEMKDRIGLEQMFILTPIPLFLSGICCLAAIRFVTGDIARAQVNEPPPAGDAPRQSP